MKHLCILLVLSTLIFLGCVEESFQTTEEESPDLILQFWQNKPLLFDELGTDRLYQRDTNEWNEELTGVIVYPDRTRGRAFEKWEYLTINVDGKKITVPRPEDSIDVGTIRNPPKSVYVSGPLKLPIYYILRTEFDPEHQECWIIKKGIIKVEYPELSLRLSNMNLKKPEPGAGGNG